MAVMNSSHHHQHPGFHIRWLENDRLVFDEDFQVRIEEFKNKVQTVL